MRLITSIILLAAAAFPAAAPRAETTGCVAITSLPFPINARGIYCLTGSLTAPAAGPAITVTADNVTIDLNGWVLSAPAGTVGGTAISAAERSTIVVRNGTIRGFATGIDVGGTAASAGNHLIEQVRVEGSREVGISAGGAGVVVRNSLVILDGVTNAGSSAHGIVVVGPGALITENVVDVRSTGGITHAIEVAFTEGGAVVERNFVSSATTPPNAVGITIKASNKVTVRDNRIANMQSGIAYIENSTGFYMRNIVSGHKVAFSGGTPAGPAGSTNFSLVLD